VIEIVMMMRKPQVTLYLSCSSPIASLALSTKNSVSTGDSLSTKNSVCDFIENTQSNQHSDFIHQALALLMKRNQMSLNQISHLVVDQGPGSFTGVRVGVTVAKTLGYSLNIRLYTLSSLHALKKKQDPSSSLYALNGFRNSLYVLKPGEETVTLMSLTEFDGFLRDYKKQESTSSIPLTLIGDALHFYKNSLSLEALDAITESVFRYPHALFMKDLFEDQFEGQLEGQPEEQFQEQHSYKNSFFQETQWFELNPFYLRLSSAEELRLEKALPNL
jgi:tRNA threonylcarbamoyladenosine biosynthesis protein TsaB